MSAPTPAPGDDRPREGYYPDPSIPGYVRYWNGAAWVPGTSRPAPADGEPLTPPPGARPAPAAVPAVEETGPHFFDEDPVEQPGPAGPPAAGRGQGGRAEPSSAWGADRSRQSGFGGDQDRRVSWGTPANPDPRLAHTAEPAVRHPDGHAVDPGRRDHTGLPDHAGRPDRAGGAERPGQGRGGAETGNTFVFRRAAAGDGTPGAAGNPQTSGIPGPGGPADEGTMTFRPVRPGPWSDPAAGPGPAAVPAQGSPASAGSSPGLAAGKAAPAQSPGFPPGRPGPVQGPQQGGAQDPAQGSAPGRTAPGGQAGAAPAQAAAAGPTGTPSPAHAPAPSLPQQGGSPQPVSSSSAGLSAAAAPGPVATPMTSGPGGGQASWAQQVHRLAGAVPAEQAGDEQHPVAPWKPPVEDVFQAAARRQAAARPAGLGRRLAARLVDTVVLAGVTAVAAVPLGTRAVDHVDEKIDAAERSGHTVTVWLLDGTTATYLGVVLAVLLLFGVVYEVLPTARWGRTLGKRLCGLQVRDIEAHEPPSLGPALRRWLVYSVPGLLGVGVVGVLWCLFDRPWRQCWHDKAAHTFVAG